MNMNTYVLYFKGMWAVAVVKADSELEAKLELYDHESFDRVRGNNELSDLEAIRIEDRVTILLNGDY